MKVLFAFYALRHNTFPYELSESVEEHDVQVQIGIEAFWQCQEQFDIIHIHWPESLFKWQEPSNEDLSKVEKTLHAWCTAGSKIVTTRHNIAKHAADTHHFNLLYEIVYKFSHAVIHFGKYSLEDYNERYGEEKFLRSQKNIIIPHGIYTAYPNDTSKATARKKLKISSRDFILLAFGQIRDREEKALLIKTIKKLSVTRKILLAPRWNLSSIRLKRILEKIYYTIHPNYRLDWNIVPSEEIQLYMNSADVVILPRLKNLNSGVLILAFTFGKVVVGTNFGVIGEILNETGNPTFDPNNINSVINAVLKGKKLAEQGKGKENRIYANTNWKWNKIAQQHVSLYKNLINKNIEL